MVDDVLRCTFEESINLQDEGPVGVRPHDLHDQVLTQSNALAELSGLLQQDAKPVKVLNVFVGRNGLRPEDDGCFVWWKPLGLDHEGFILAESRPSNSPFRTSLAQLLDLVQSRVALLVYDPHPVDVLCRWAQRSRCSREPQLMSQVLVSSLAALFSPLDVLHDVRLLVDVHVDIARVNKLFGVQISIDVIRLSANISQRKQKRPDCPQRFQFVEA